MSFNIKKAVGLQVAVWVWAIGLGMGGSAWAQQKRSKLDLLLERVPVASVEARTDLIQRMSGCGSSEIERLCALARDASNSKARRLLFGWVLALEELPDPQRDWMAKSLVEAFASSPDAESRRFFLEQLHSVDPTAGVRWLSQQLPQNTDVLQSGVIEDVVRAARVAPSDRVAGELRRCYASLPESAGADVRMAILSGLAAMEDLESAELFRAALQRAGAATSFGLRTVALDGLAAIGDERSAALFARELQSPSPTARATAARRLGDLAEALAEQGKTDSARGIYASLLSEPAGQPIPVRLMALDRAVALDGVKALTAILEALNHPDASLRAAGLRLALGLEGEGVDAKLRERLSQSLDAPQADPTIALLEVVGRRALAVGRSGDPDPDSRSSARAEVLRATRDENPSVRKAGWVALTRLDPYGSLDPILEALRETSVNQTRKQLVELAVGLPGESVDSRVANQLEGAPTPLALALIEILSRRNQPGQLQTLSSQAQMGDARVRRAAIRAMGQMTTELAPAVELLRSAQDERDRMAIQRMGLTVIGRGQVADGESSVLALLQGLEPDDVKRRATVVAWLGALGGDRAFDAILSAWRDPREELREAAVDALKRWPDPRQAPGVLAVAEKSTDLKEHVLALRSYLRLVVKDSEAGIEDRLASFERAFRVARRPEEQKFVIGQLAELPHPKTLEFLHQFEGSRSVGLEAEIASLRVAEAMLPAKWSFVREKCSYLSGVTEHDAVRELAQRIDAKAKKYDFIADWNVAGPYSKDGNPKQRNLLDPFAPEIAGQAAQVEWRTMPVNASDYWLVDLTKISGQSNCVAYLHTRVRSRTAKKAILELGSDDGLRVWWNGKSVHHNPTARGCTAGQDRVEVEFQKGWNDVVLKVSQIGGGWAACLRIVGPDGSPISDLKIKPGQTPPKF